MFFKGLTAKSKREEEATRTAKKKRREAMDVEEERKKNKKKYWDTPELAYCTWQSRIKDFIESANRYIDLLKAESKQAMQQYGAEEFHLTDELNEEQKRIGSISPQELSYKEMDLPFKGEHYMITMNGQQILVNKELSTPIGKGYLENPYDLEIILRKIFRPEIAAKRIKEGRSPITQWSMVISEFGQILKETHPKDYSFKCDYGISELRLRDIKTKMIFDDISVVVHNPFYGEYTKQILIDSFCLKTHS